MALPYAVALALLDHLGPAQGVLQTAIGVLGGRRPQLGQLLEAALLDFTSMDLDNHALAVERVAQAQEQTLGTGPGAAMMRAVLAFHEAQSGRARERCAALAVDALDEGLLSGASDVLLGCQRAVCAHLHGGDPDRDPLHR